MPGSDITNVAQVIASLTKKEASASMFFVTMKHKCSFSVQTSIILKLYAKKKTTTFKYFDALNF
jgi:hypothetical protein